MNSNREERLQMRQRGAATRKPKEVDFGFSFGGFGAAIDPPPASTAQQQPPQPQSQPAGIVEPPAPSANVKPLPSSPTTRPLGSQEQAVLQRTPGSARNARPARPSMFDIPDEDEEPPGSARRNKRRKIETPTKVSRKTSTGLDSKRDEGARLAEPRRDGATTTTSVTEKPGEVPVVPPALGQVEQQPSTEVPVSAPSMPHGESKTNGDSQPEVVEAPSQEAPQEAPVPAQPEAPVEVPVKRSPETTKAPQPQEAQETPTAETAAPETSPTQAPQAQPKRTTPPRQDTKAKRKKRELPETQATAPETVETSQEQAPPPQEQQEPERTTPPRQAKRKKRESPVAQGTPAAEPAPAQEPEPQEEKRPSPPRQAKGKQRRRESQEDQVSPENIAVPETTEKTLEPTQEPTQPQPPENQEPAEEAPIPKPREKKQKGQLPASAQTPSDKGKSADKGKKPEERPVSDEPVRDQGKRGRRGREDKARNPFKDTTDGKPIKPVDRPQKPKDDATETRPQQPSPEMKATRKRTGRPKKTAQPEEEAEVEAEPAQPGPSAPTRGADPDDRAAEQETTEEPTQAPARRRRKPQSRGETVPVTVHRLANMPSLSGKPSTSDTSSEDESADELSTRHKTKLPNRGGVNQADVLNQICRETLEKTLTTLKNGIAEETNTARKAEWTRKKKVVETYGTELEGRLLEMSEMLDSNFVLGVQLKRAKREMMEMRSRLYHVRREREAIAVQMDIVRRKHGEEERARVARTEINNTLHSLELAVHRSQHRPEDEGSTSTNTAAGLEYLVRTVAEDVGSRGHGQGGLLRQIQSFNAELEAVARRLEG